jgi:hypothetical protein
MSTHQTDDVVQPVMKKSSAAAAAAANDAAAAAASIERGDVCKHLTRIEKIMRVAMVRKVCHLKQLRAS